MNRTQIALPGQEIAPPQPQTWTADIGVPLTQNLLGGVAVAGLVGVVWRAVGELPADWWIPAVLAGSAVACIATITRYFGDDVGIVTAAYNAGRRSRDAEVNALHLQLRENADAMAQAGDGATPATVQAKQLLVANATLKHARLILQVAFAGDSISREAMAQRNVGQRDWERAVRLCKAAGVLDEYNALIVRSHRDALSAVEKLHADGYGLMAQRPNYRPAWY